MIRKTYIDIDTDSDEDDKTRKALINVYVTGYPKTGKTSIVKRIVFNTFNLIEKSTKSIEIYKKINVGTYIFRVWDVPYHLFETISLKVNDVLIYVVSNVIPPMPKVPVRMWIVSREHVDTTLPFVKVDAMCNTGIKTILKKIIKSFQGLS